MRIYRPAVAPTPVPALYWMHGGRMMIRSMDMDEDLLVGAVDQFGFAVVSVEYRLAPEHPHPAPVEDCYAGLVWTQAHAPDYGIDSERIAVGGPSAGGGLAAGTALIARDRGGPRLVFQLLLEPMLDDRSTTYSSTQYEGTTVWDRTDNAHGWRSLLGDQAGREGVSPYAAPARARSWLGCHRPWSTWARWRPFETRHRIRSPSSRRRRTDGVARVPGSVTASTS